MEHLSRHWEERRAPTLKDVARAVGVSEAVASVVLNGARSGTRVSEHRRQEVIDAAARIGYRPNSLARALQAGRNHRVGFYSGRQAIDSRSLFFTELLGGVCAGANAQDSNVVLLTAADSELRLRELLTGASLDGLVLQCRPEDEIFPLLEDLRLPAVVINDAASLSLPIVGVDEAQGGALQAERMAERGHRHVLYKQSRELTLSVQIRMSAFVSRARELGIRTTIRYQDDFDEPIDPADIALVTEGPNRATAVVGWHDHSADRICARLTEAGLQIPGQVAVLGFDGFPSYHTPRFQLSTVRAPWFEVGRTAVDLIAALLRGEKVPHITSLPVEFVPGSTD